MKCPNCRRVNGHLYWCYLALPAIWTDIDFQREIERKEAVKRLMVAKGINRDVQAGVMQRV